MQCSSCSRIASATDCDVLSRIPLHIASNYPVDPKYALCNWESHVARTATDIFDQIMTTYGNGELCSRMLYNAINRAYLQYVASYYSFYKEYRRQFPTRIVNAKEYVRKDAEFIPLYPPLGDSIFDLYDAASSNSDVPWQLSDHDRHTREIQSVLSCQLTMAQDHTFDVVKNYQKSVDATALWDCSTETGEIACAVLVPSTQTRHFSHAAQQLAKRDRFHPRVLYSDTWPTKDAFWRLLFSDVEGRLGLFHYLQRITRTLRKKHVDYHDAIARLLEAVYVYHSNDYEAVIRALKDGTLGKKKHTDNDIALLRGTKIFRQRYSKYIRKVIRPPTTMVQKLDDWFVQFKVTASEGSTEARGRLDP
jgi:hypothetical protein